MKLWTLILYLVARWEVLRSRLGNRLVHESDCEDLLPFGLIPSVTPEDRSDRVLAEIDQDGFVFARTWQDARLFRTRDTLAVRKHHRVEIVLRGGRVRLRKAVLQKPNDTLVARLRESLQLELYLEAAALLRLQGLPGVPAIRRIDPDQGTIEMDYIWGADLRQVLADGQCEIDYENISQRFTALLSNTDNESSQQIAELLVSVIARGVIPRDVHAANFVVGHRTKRIYIVDFNLIYLWPVPGWHSHAQQLMSIIGRR